MTRPVGSCNVRGFLTCPIGSCNVRAFLDRPVCNFNVRRFLNRPCAAGVCLDGQRRSALRARLSASSGPSPSLQRRLALPPMPAQAHPRITGTAPEQIDGLRARGVVYCLRGHCKFHHTQRRRDITKVDDQRAWQAPFEWRCKRHHAQRLHDAPKYEPAPGRLKNSTRRAPLKN